MLARRIREIASTREAILDAAGRAFAEAGYEKATMTRIAQEAGYTVPSLYAYFKSKQDIFEALMLRVDQEFLAPFEQSFPLDLSFRQRVEVLLRRLNEIADCRRETLTVFLSLRESGGAPKRREPGAQSGLVAFMARCERWIGEAALPSELGGYSAAEAACTLVGIQNAFFQRWLDSERNRKMVEHTELVLTLFFSALRREPAPARAPAR